MGLYQIVHMYDVDGGLGDAVTQESVVGIVSATEKEIEEFLKEWDRPEIYSSPYQDLYRHHVFAKPIDVKSLDEIIPYKRNWIESDYDNMTLYVTAFCVGADAKVWDKDEKEMRFGKVAEVIDWYKEKYDDNPMLDRGYDADGEFITDDAIMFVGIVFDKEDDEE